MTRAVQLMLGSGGLTGGDSGGETRTVAESLPLPPALLAVSWTV